MSSLSSILQIGKSALSAHQLANQIAGNNIANVNTEGYSRRVAALRSLVGIQTPWGEAGGGVTALSINRYRDQFLDAQVRSARSQLADWNLRDAQLQRVDALFTETDGVGFGTRLDEFFNAWHDLANDPQSSAMRANLRQKSLALIDIFHNLAGSLNSQRLALDRQIAGEVNEVNELIKRVAALNGQIVAAGEASGGANNLLDERDLLLDRLSELVDVQVIRQNDGAVGVYINSQNVVERAEYQELKLVAAMDDQAAPQAIITDDGGSVVIAGGELSGLLELRDVTLPDYVERLNQLAKNLVEEVNTLHRAGYNPNGTSGINFFDPEKTEAATVDLSAAIQSDVNNIAAGASTASGDSTQALAIADLKSATLAGLGTSINDYYTSLIAEVGAAARHAGDSRAHLQIVEEQLSIQREAVQGVSLDEEMADLIRFQHAYDAAAKLIQTADAMMQSILNMV